jgi:hypothetical protein
MDVTISRADVADLASILHDLTEPTKDGRAITELDRVSALKRLAETGELTNYSKYLPMGLRLKGQPYTLDDYFPFEPMFSTFPAPSSVWKTGRQCSKSTGLASCGVTRCLMIPHFSILYVTPLYEQIRRFSTNYVRPFVEESPLRTAMMGAGVSNNVLQRNFRNNSRMYFSFALTDAERCRGISSDNNVYDEYQNIDRDLVPIIHETTSASQWRLQTFAGTPKTLDNSLEKKWLDSSQAEWVIKCLACGKYNIPSVEHDLDKMIGPYSDDICEDRPGVICANPRCQKPISPRLNGRWRHRRPHLINEMPGYHVPQILLPLHYAKPKRWRELLGKREGVGNITVPQYYNEVLGESYDVGAKLLTETDLKKAALLNLENKPDHPIEAVKRCDQYILRVLGVDWGGGGEAGLSWTAMAVVGLRGDGRLDVIYGRRLLTPNDSLAEAQEILNVYRMFRCHHIAHDYNGAGAIRELIIHQAGVALEKIVPMVYMATASGNIMRFHAAEEKHSRNYWLLDKARSLLLMCQCIRMQWIRLFNYDWKSTDEQGLQYDLLALMENRIEVARGRDVYTIIRNPTMTDDFAHAVNFAACTIWHRTQRWPQLATIAKIREALAKMEEQEQPPPST